MFNYHPKLIEHMIEQTQKTVFALLIVSLVFIYTYYIYIPVDLLLFWTVAQVLFIVLRFKNSNSLKRYIQNGDEKQTKRYITYFFILLIYSSFVWGTAVYLSLLYAPLNYELISFIMILGITTAGILSLSSILHAYLMYFLLMLIPLFLRMIYIGDRIHIILAIFLFIYIVVIVLLSKSMYKNRIKSIHNQESLQKSIEELHKLSITDSLTKIYNRRYFFEAGENLIEIAKRESKPISLLMLDIDYFKNVNDTYGHQAGDTVLIELTKAINSMVRKSDIFARIGGEEFALVLHNTSKQGAVIIANKIRKTVQNHHFKHDNIDIAVTISVGVSSLNSDYNDLDALYKDADVKLYEAKRVGRNIVIAKSV